MTLDEIQDLEGKVWICELAARAPEPPAWWFNSNECKAIEGGLERDVAWRVKWAFALIERVIQETAAGED